MVAVHFDDTVPIEYVGDPPVIDEIMQFRLARGEFLPEAEAIIRQAEMERCTAIKGIDKRQVDPEYFGTSRQYIFGPLDYVVDVERRDVDKIMGSASGHQFRRVGDPINDLVLPRQPFRFVDEFTLTGADGAKRIDGDVLEREFGLK
jgi:hypothetical protein